MANDTPPTWEETNAPPTWESTTEFGAGDVLRSVAPGSLSPDTLLPAVRLMGGETVTGEPGDTHPDIIEREGIAAKDLDQRGFTGPGGIFIDREAAAQGTQLPTEFEPGRLHSTDLIQAQESQQVPTFEAPLEITEKGPVYKSQLEAEKYGSLEPSNLTAWQQLRRTETGREIFGPTPEERELGIMPGQAPGIVPLALTAPLPFGPGPETALGKAMIGGFIAQFVSQAPDAWNAFQSAVERGDWNEAGKIAVETGFGAAFTALAGKGLHEQLRTEISSRATPTPSVKPEVVPVEETPAPVEMKSTEDAQKVGLESKTVEDLERLAEDRRNRVAEKDKLMERLKVATDPKEQESLFNELQQIKTQLPREAIETATNSGSAVEGESATAPSSKLGPRPLDWRQNPEVANWLKENGAELGIKLPEELVATALESREGFEGKPMEADAIWKRLEEQHGIKRGGAVELINDPKAEAAGRILLDKEGKPIGIELNQVRLATQAQIDWVLQHEAAHWFDVTNPKITEDILRTVPDAEWEGVFNNVVKLGYSTEKVPYEISARSIQQLADAWKGRGWFDKLVGNVQRFAHETLGIKMTRRAAESTAVRAIAQSIKRIGETAATKPDVSAAMAAWRQRTAAPKPVEPAPSMAVVRRGEMGIGQPVEEKFPRTKRFLRHMGDVERTLSQIKPGDKIEYIDPDGRIVESNFVRFEERDTPDGISSFAVLKDAVSGKEYGVEAEILAEHHLQPMAKQFEDIRESLESSIRMAERPGDYANPELAKEYRDRLNALRSRVIDVEATPMSFEARMPGIESAEDIKKGVQSLMLPSAKSPEHLRAAELLASKLGPMHHRGEVAANKLSQWSKAFDKLGVHREDVPLPENTGIQFMSAMSQGKPLSGPKAQAASELIQKLFAERIDALEKAGAPLETVRENYFPGMWTRESRLAFNAAMEKLGEGIDVNNATAAQKEAIKSLVDQYLAEGVGSEKDALGYLTRRPMKGKESFRKQKVFDDIMDGVEFGLRPVSNNPIDLVQLKLAEMDRSIMANEYFKALKDKGELKVIPPGREIPEGWQKVNDRYGTIYGPPVEGVFGRRIMGYRIVPEAHGDIINNYLSSSLYNNRYFGPLYKGWMSLANALNQTQLGMGSAFHGGFTTGEAQISAGANVLKDIYGVLRGNRSVKDLGRSVAKASMATVQNPIIGDRVLNAWRERDAQINPRIAQVVKAAELAGAGFKLETGLRTEQSTKLLRDWYSGNRLKAAARSPVALTELLAKPIMEYLVPRQKAGVFADLAWRIIEQNPGRSLEELTPQFRQAWNRVDARLGQVRYDRLFINNTAKNVVQGLVRAPGWSGGTIAEIGGGFADAGKFLSEWVKTGRLPQNIPDRTAYVLSLLTTVMATNAALTYAFTGTKPTGLDYFAFRTGSKDEQGRDERFLIPSYMKDILAYAKHPGQTLINKAHPLIGMISDLIKNRDYYGVEIRSRDAGPVKKAGETVAYVAKGFEPFWTRGTRREVERGAAPVSPRTVAPLVGIMPAPRSVTQTKAEGLAHDLMLERIPAGARTKESAERARLRAEKTKGQDYLTRTVKRLDVESAMRVWNAATPEEKQKIKSEVLSKIGRSRTLTREREQDLKNLVNSAIP